MQVAVRLRPLVPNEINSGCRSSIEKIFGQPQIVVGSNQTFSFNFVFDESDGQLKIYEDCAQPLISKLFEGIILNCIAMLITEYHDLYQMFLRSYSYYM